MVQIYGHFLIFSSLYMALFCWFLSTSESKPMKNSRIFRRWALILQVESRKNRKDVLFHVQAILKTENALREGYGLVGPDAPLFNRTGALVASTYVF
jgi:hypothetical protein